MNTEEHIKELNYEISKLKEKLLLTENELNETKHKLNTYQSNSKKYYENNRDKIIERVKKYNNQNNYKPRVSSDKRKEYNKIAYQKKKRKGRKRKIRKSKYLGIINYL
jgi:hypothetical protein